jgi:hypothetical protein
VEFVAGNSNKLQKKWIWKEKSVELSICFTLPNLEIFNSENVKNSLCNQLSAQV